MTQTTLSVDDTAEIVAALKRRFPAIAGPHKEDICYATTNRQEAVKRVAPVVDAMIVVGSPNSSNSQRLKEVAVRAGCPHADLLQRADDIDWEKFGQISRLGLTAGASAPEDAGRGDHRRVRGALRRQRGNGRGGRGVGDLLSAAAPASRQRNGGIDIRTDAGRVESP